MFETRLGVLVSCACFDEIDNKILHLLSGVRSITPPALFGHLGPVAISEGLDFVRWRLSRLVVTGLVTQNGSHYSAAKGSPGNYAPAVRNTPAEQRRAQILDFMETKPGTIGFISAQLSFSAVNVRRDIDLLEAKGKVKRLLPLRGEAQAALFARVPLPGEPQFDCLSCKDARLMLVNSGKHQNAVPCIYCVPA